jgi:nicotinamidase-related amidase
MEETNYIGPGDKPPAFKTALLLVDVQNDYFPGGANELVGAVEAAANAARLLEFFRTSAHPVFHMQHVSNRPGAAFFLPGTNGVKIHESVAPRPGELVLEKQYPNAFRDKKLLPQLSMAYVARLVICGMMTHMCVDATVRAASDLTFECIVASDACATKALSFGGRTVTAEDVHAAFLAALGAAYAKIMTTDEILVLLAPPRD